MLQFLPYALAAYGGYKGYQGAKDSGASGIGRLLGAAGGAYGGYQLGAAGMNLTGQSFTPYSQLGQQYSALQGLPFQQAAAPVVQRSPVQNFPTPKTPEEEASLMEILLKRKQKDGTYSEKYDPLKVSGLLTAGLLATGAYNQGPTDIYTPGYNIGYAALREQRPGYTYIDPTTGEEKAYEKVYAPEADPANRGDFQSGPYAMNRTRLKTGGLAEIKKFNEGGINYLPSKVSHDENDANNYVRASGYVEDGSGNGDKDEDTMLAQLADGEFVTRADGVLGAGIIAGANPNSMKDMREKGAKYFYDQQAKYKRVFDLIKDKNETNKEKA